MKFLSAIFLAAIAIAPIAADTGKTEPMSIIDLAAADGKYGTLLSAVTNTPGVLDAVVEAFPVSKLLYLCCEDSMSPIETAAIEP